VRQTPDNAEAVACVGYTLHRLGDDKGAAEALERALAIDADHVEARIYLGNLLYDANDYPGRSPTSSAPRPRTTGTSSGSGVPSSS
jgi:Tfp pilus assembly protein PilF